MILGPSTEYSSKPTNKRPTESLPREKPIMINDFRLPVAGTEIQNSEIRYLHVLRIAPAAQHSLTGACDPRHQIGHTDLI